MCFSLHALKKVRPCPLIFPDDVMLLIVPVQAAYVSLLPFFADHLPGTRQSKSLQDEQLPLACLLPFQDFPV